VILKTESSSESLQLLKHMNGIETGTCCTLQNGQSEEKKTVELLHIGRDNEEIVTHCEIKNADEVLFVMFRNTKNFTMSQNGEENNQNSP